MYLVTVSSCSHKKIVRFNIAMDEALAMYVLYTTYHLRERERVRIE